jgi:hypothetical protein
MVPLHVSDENAVSWRQPSMRLIVPPDIHPAIDGYMNSRSTIVSVVAQHDRNPIGDVMIDERIERNYISVESTCHRKVIGAGNRVVLKGLGADDGKDSDLLAPDLKGEWGQLVTFPLQWCDVSEFEDRRYTFAVEVRPVAVEDGKDRCTCSGFLSP